MSTKARRGIATAGLALAATAGGIVPAHASEPLPPHSGNGACIVLHSVKNVSATVAEFRTWAQGPCDYAHAVLTTTISMGGKNVGPTTQKFCNNLVSTTTRACLLSGIKLRVKNPAGKQTFWAIGYVEWLSSGTGGRTRGDYTKWDYSL